MTGKYQQRSAHQQAQGFTMVELVTVIVLIGIISAIALPRMFSRDVFDSRAYYDQVLAALRYAQKAAISQRRNVCVNFPAFAGGSRLVLNTTANFADIACANPVDLQNPAQVYPPGQTTYTIENSNGVTLIGAVAFNFDALGRPSFAGAGPLTIAVSAYTANSICVAAQTGYVYSC
jgi:MSHA pilin protein MshC